MNAPPEARRIFAMAMKDWQALQGMLESPLFADEIVGFHAQQAIEKALKAWLSALGFEPPHTHELGRLLLALEDGGAEVIAFRSLAAYSAFGVQFRYEAFEDDSEEILDRLKVIEEVGFLLRTVEAHLPD